MGTHRTLIAATFVVIQLLPNPCSAGHHNFSVFFSPLSGSLNPDPPKDGSNVSAKGRSGPVTLFVDDGLGFHANGEITFRPWRPLSFIGDVSVHLVGLDDDDATQVTFMGGPRIAFPDVWKAHSFFHLMILGATHVSESRLNLESTSYAFALGAGIDLIPGTRFVRDKAGNKTGEVEGRQGVRLEVDWIVPVNGKMGKSWRISLGYVWWFLEHNNPCPCGGVQPPQNGRENPRPPSI